MEDAQDVQSFEADVSNFFIGKLAFNFTNVCDLRCVYCPQGTHADEFYADTTDEQIERIIAFVRANKVPVVNIGYYGETTLVAGWEKHCAKLLDAGVTLNIVANFAKVLKPEELEVLVRFDRIEISIDTVNLATLRRVRKALDGKTVVFNTMTLQAEAMRQGLRTPNLVWSGVLTDAVVMEMPALARMAVKCGIKLIHFNEMVYFAEAKDALRNVYDMPNEQFIGAVAAIEQARRIAADSGVFFSTDADVRIERRYIQEYGAEAYEAQFHRLYDFSSLKKGRNLYVYGSGSAGRSLFRALKAQPDLSVCGFLDTYGAAHCEEAEVYRFEDYLPSARPNDLILICTRYEDLIESDLKSRGVRNYLKACSFQRVNFTRVAPAVLAEQNRRVGIQGVSVKAGDERDRLPPGKTRLCSSPWDEVYLDPRGEVYSCCRRGVVMGRLSGETSLEDILAGPDYRALRRELLTGNGVNPDCAACHAMPVVDPHEMSAFVRTLGGR